MEELLINGLKFLIFPGVLFVFLFALFTNWFDRWLYARMQNRIGPRFLQPLYDLVKLLAKEDITPEGVDQPDISIYVSLQVIITLLIAMFVPVYAGWGIISFEADIVFILFLLALFGGTAMLIGWSSKNPYSQIGAGRAAVQEMAFELPLALALFTPAIIVGSLSIAEITSVGPWGSFGYTLDNNPAFLLPLFVMFVIAILAAVAVCEKVPFDTPEAEMEIVGGWTAELSGKKYAFVHLSANILEFALAGLIAAIFLGGPFLPANAVGDGIVLNVLGRDWNVLLYLVSFIVFIIKLEFVMFFLVLARTVFGRLRVDQVANYFWQGLLPVSLFVVGMTIALGYLL
jgi:NADH-quinone oxidoreductase subunit H